MRAQRVVLAVPETPLRTPRGERVFLEDVVELRVRADRLPVERVILEGEGTELRLGVPNSGRVERLHAPGQANAVTRRLGSAASEPYLRRRYAAALEGGASDLAAGWGGPAVIAAGGVIGGVGSALLQLGLSGSIGPLGTTLGAGLGLAWMLRRHARGGQRLRHHLLFNLAWRAGLLVGLALAGARLFVLDAPPGGLGAWLVAGGGMGALGFLGTFALVTILGNSHDHYLGDKAATLSSPERTAPRLREGGARRPRDRSATGGDLR